ncbi:MAG: ThiF family adenylyltransferase, partial [Clostridia bacterium]|nr:ThiF family adenylyltransferase [Clostridia bacterium]
MNEFYERTARMLGKEAVGRLQNARIALFGLGGVGGHAAEALARAGVGHLTLVDGDTVSASNMNRQLFALQSTVGLSKTEAATRRLLDINPSIDIDARHLFVTEDNLS